LNLNNFEQFSRQHTKVNLTTHSIEEADDLAVMNDETLIESSIFEGISGK